MIEWMVYFSQWLTNGYRIFIEWVIAILRRHRVANNRPRSWQFELKNCRRRRPMEIVQSATAAVAHCTLPVNANVERSAFAQPIQDRWAQCVGVWVHSVCLCCVFAQGKREAWAAALLCCKENVHSKFDASRLLTYLYEIVLVAAATVVPSHSHTHPLPILFFFYSTYFYWFCSRFGANEQVKCEHTAAADERNSNETSTNTQLHVSFCVKLYRRADDGLIYMVRLMKSRLKSFLINSIATNDYSITTDKVICSVIMIRRMSIDSSKICRIFPFSCCSHSRAFALSSARWSHSTLHLCLEVIGLEFGTYALRSARADDSANTRHYNIIRLRDIFKPNFLSNPCRRFSSHFFGPATHLPCSRALASSSLFVSF